MFVVLETFEKLVFGNELRPVFLRTKHLSCTDHGGADLCMVLEGKISAVLLHPAKNPEIKSPKGPK